MRNFDPDWWQRIFDEVYLATDARSIANAEVTRVEVDLIEDTLNPGTKDFVLDLCGGQGRHALELARRGYRNIFVIDYSLPLLVFGSREANKNHLSGISFIRCDARYLCVADSAFDHVVIMGNSFGYFRDNLENKKILSEVLRILKPEGRILIDLINKDYVIASFRPQSWHEATDDLIVCRDRTLVNDGVIVREVVLSKKRGLVRDITYFTRLYEKEEIHSILKNIGFREVSFVDEFKPHKTKGDYGMLSNRVVVSAVAGKS